MKIPLSNIHLSVVVTVYSETFSVVETILRLVAKDRGYLKEIILLVAPKSSQESFDICHKLEQENPLVRVVVQQRTPGLGWAYREGMQAATGNYVGLMSGDLETEPEAMDRMVRKIEETGCECVTASRWIPGGSFENYDKLKLVLNWIFQKIFRILYWTKLTDLTYGLKILSKDAAEKIQWEGTLHEIAMETTVKPLKAGYTFEEVPTAWIGRREGVSKNNFWKNFRYVRLAIDTLFHYKYKKIS